MKLASPVLIVEDDRNTASLIRTYLEREGFRSITVHDGEQALELVRRRRPGFVILDIMLPGLDGWEICRELRTFSDVPVLILTAREEEIDRVMGLSIGADDYVVKPFSPRELVERVKAILRRSRGHVANSKNVVSRGGLTLDPVKQKVTLHDRPVELTSLEYRILQALMQAPGKVFSRDELLDACYPGGQAVVDRVIDVHIGKLRQKIEKDPGRPNFVLTRRGFGYSFNEDLDG